MKRVALLWLLVASAAVADVLLKNAGATIGPVTSINCAPDAGLFCVRDAGSVGTLKCNGATASEPGCVTPSAQTFAGAKTFNDYVRLNPVAHASLIACDAGHKDMMQGCSDHGALVWCDGTNNIEITGTAGTERTLFSVYVNGVPMGSMGSNKVASPATVTAIGATWAAGTSTDAGVLTFRITDGTNLCNCSVSCTSPAARTACSGSCSYAASATLTPVRVAGGCISDPVAVGNVQVLGTSP